MAEQEIPAAIANSVALNKNYRVSKFLGKGSFGSVVLVRSKADNKRWVAKSIETANMSPKEKNDITKEIQIMASMNHPNIVRYKEHFEEGTMMFIIMEYADGGDLNQRIKERKKVPEGQTPELFEPKLVMFWFLQVAMALKYLHDKKVLHRDLKSANVFLTSKNVVKLGDFGISTVLANTVACAKTVCGTPYYFSPELCQSKPYNNKSDVWAVGVMLYEMLTLNRPFNAKNLRDLLKRIVSGQYEPVPESVPLEIRQLQASLLNLNPALRPSVNRVLEMPYIQAQLKIFSEEMQRQTQRDREEYEKKKAAAPAASPAVSSPAKPAEPVVPAANAAAGKMNIKGINPNDLKAQFAQQGNQIDAEIEARKAAASKALAQGGAGGAAAAISDAASLEDEAEYVAQQQQLAVGSKAVHLSDPKARLGGHEDEFGDADAAERPAETITLANGKVVPASEARAALVQELGEPLLLSALNFVNELVAQPNAPSNAQIQRELNSLLGTKLSVHSGAITRLANYEARL